MGTKVYSNTLSLRELYNKLFKSKKCPNCEAVRKQVKRTEEKGLGWHRDPTESGFSYVYGEASVVKRYYYCEACDIETALKDI